MDKSHMGSSHLGKTHMDSAHIYIEGYRSGMNWVTISLGKIWIWLYATHTLILRTLFPLKTIKYVKKPKRQAPCRKTW